MSDPVEAVPPAILVEHLTKTYKVGRRPPAVPLPRLWSSRTGNRPEPRRDREIEDPEDETDDLGDEPDDEPEPAAPGAGRMVCALRDVSLTVPAGSMLGLLGPPGAGKTTLLKVLARITPPTEGRVVIRGRVAPLLELASAFMNPDGTGRDNAYHLARLFGVPAEVVDRRLEEMFAFAELGSKVDHLAQTYSSSQYRRLGFAIALHLEPDVLLVDERLVGADEPFAERCFARLQAAREEGLTLLFASSDVSAIAELCDEAVWLEDGELLDRGAPQEIADRARERRSERRRAARGREEPQLPADPVEGPPDAPSSNTAVADDGGVEPADGTTAPDSPEDPQPRPVPDRATSALLEFLELAQGPARARKALNGAMKSAQRAGYRHIKWYDLAAAAGLERKEAEAIAIRMMSRDDEASNEKRRIFNEHVAILGATVRGAGAEPVETLRADETAELELELEVATPGVTLRAAIILVPDEGAAVRIEPPHEVVVKVPGTVRLVCELPADVLTDAFYTARATVRTYAAGRKGIVQRPDVFSVQVYNARDPDAAEEDADPSQLALGAMRWRRSK